MSWIRKRKERPWLERFCGDVLKCGPVPKHVAFIMDGNRRFARKRSMERAEGHLKGFDKLAETLEWCLDMGITEVTVYAFSIENFKRSKDEVDGLLELARQKFAKLLEEKEMLQKHGVCIRVLGNLSLLPRDIQQIIAEAVHFTRSHDKAVLNVCFAYTSREEITSAVRDVVEGVQSGMLHENDITEDLLEQCMYTHASPDPDMVIRTSGEVRLSDFLLWQSSYSVLSFIKVLWPDFSIWHLYLGILHYQRNHEAIQVAKEEEKLQRERVARDELLQEVLTEINSLKPNGQCRDDAVQQKVQQCGASRTERVNAFLSHIQARREESLQELCAHLHSTALS